MIKTICVGFCQNMGVGKEVGIIKTNIRAKVKLPFIKQVYWGTIWCGVQVVIFPY